MRRIFGAQVIAIIRRVFAAVVRKIVPAVVALAAGHIGANNDSISHPQRDSFEVGVLSVSSNRSDRSNVFVALNDREFQFSAAVLRGVALKSVFVCSADAGHLYLD